jgi:hypothetical protein
MEDGEWLDGEEKGELSVLQVAVLPAQLRPVRLETTVELTLEEPAWLS